MQLITLAHLGEAQGLIDRLGLKKASDSLYEGERVNCLITGEGPFEAGLATASELARKDYQEVINLGISGSLTPSLEVGSIHEIRSLYLAIEGKPQFRSFPLSERGVDLLTSFERILDPRKAEILKGVAKLVDREAWGVAFACKEARVKLRSYKIVSDFAGSIEACELVKEKAQFFSLKLADYYQNEIQENVPEVKATAPLIGPEFYFTFSSSHRFKSTLEKLSLLRGNTQEEIIGALNLDDLRERKLSPKERTRILLEMLDDELDPFNGRIKENILRFKKKWGERGIHLQTDPQFENEKFQISFEVSNSEELAQKIKELQELDLAPLQNIFKGEIDVE